MVSMLYILSVDKVVRIEMHAALVVFFKISMNVQEEPQSQNIAY